MNIFKFFSHFHYLLSLGMWEKRLCTEEAVGDPGHEEQGDWGAGDAGLRVVRPRVQQLHARGRDQGEDGGRAHTSQAAAREGGSQQLGLARQDQRLRQSSRSTSSRLDIAENSCN